MKRERTMKTRNNASRNARSHISVIVAAALLITAVFGGALTASAAPAAFTDVSASYWAKSDIDFAASKGIVNGYQQYDGTYTFAPENSVTYEEAATMLYRSLVAAGKAKDISAIDVTKYDEAIAAANISDWAKSYVVYGLAAGIIDQSELAIFVNKDTMLGNPAPRITVAIWTAKALGKQYAGMHYLPYTDAEMITDEEAKYVDLLYRQGIMQGSLQTDGTIAFKPDSGVKRSEFAAISNRVYNNTAAGSDYTKDIFNYEVSSAKEADTPQLRVASDARVYGDWSNFSVISGIALPDGEAPQIHLVGTPKVQSGQIKTVENLTSDITKVGIEMSGVTVYYIIDTFTENGAQIKAGTNASFINDGIKIIEIK